MINMILLPESQNTKTGNIIQSYSSPSSCPVSYPFKESGCYAKKTHTAKVWERVDNREDKRFIGCQDDLVNALTGALWLDKGDRDEAVTEKEYGLNVVLTSIYPEADIAALKAKGIPAVQCPAQTKGITCKECRLCSRDREAVVLFEVHGQSKGKARRVIQIKRAKH